MLNVILKQSILLLIIGIIIPLILFYFEKYKNKNRIQKKNLKKMLITYYIVCSIIYIGITIAVLVEKHSKPINTSKPIPEPQIETKAEYYYKKGKYGHDITSTKYAFTEEDKPFCNSQGKWMLHGISGEISEPIIERKYTFFGLGGLDQCQYPEKVPKDLAPFIKEPFDNWYYTDQMKPYIGFRGSGIDHFDSFDIDTLSNEESKLNPTNSRFDNSFVRQGHTIKMDYKGPKYLLEKDEDLYVNEVECPLQKKERYEDNKTAKYYLHFNPKKQYITLYTDKMNTKEN